MLTVLLRCPALSLCVISSLSCSLVADGTFAMPRSQVYFRDAPISGPANSTLTALSQYPTVSLAFAMSRSQLCIVRLLSGLTDGRSSSTFAGWVHCPEDSEGLEEESDLIGCIDAVFAWSDESGGALTLSKRKFRLCIDGEIYFQHGRINLVVRPTGSGKTSVPMALLGEMHFMPSGPTSWFNLPRKGGVAYAAQESWVQNETIRNQVTGLADPSLNPSGNRRGNFPRKTDVLSANATSSDVVAPETGSTSSRQPHRNFNQNRSHDHEKGSSNPRRPPGASQIAGSNSVTDGTGDGDARPLATRRNRPQRAPAANELNFADSQPLMQPIRNILYRLHDRKSCCTCLLNGVQLIRRVDTRIQTSFLSASLPSPSPSPSPAALGKLVDLRAPKAVSSVSSGSGVWAKPQPKVAEAGGRWTAVVSRPGSGLGVLRLRLVHPRARQGLELPSGGAWVSSSVQRAREAAGQERGGEEEAVPDDWEDDV
ncbi:hypothetical protein EDB19DRAFT_1831244 [Suillus lakei]|nr:hypothetical protein EDB19DRAFT_1831244 [Suillus lakei]